MMKKSILTIMMLVSNILLTFAQGDIIINITDCPGIIGACLANNQRVLIYAQEGCEDFHWSGVAPSHEHDNPLIVDPQQNTYWQFSYHGCNGFYHDMVIQYDETPIPNEFTSNIWKHQGEMVRLEALGADSLEPYYQYQWSNGQTTWRIDVIEAGDYTCTITVPCGTSIRTFDVKDKVEPYRATVDLASGLNKVTWQTSPEQAEYISQVKVERDGMVVGTAPYEDGQFIDNIGSENAARNYRLTAITAEGDECPIPSYQLGTLHVDYSSNASNPNKLNMAWTPPFIEEGAPYSVSYFQICKYDPATGEVTVVDQLGANNTIGSYDVSLFDGGYAVVAAMFNEGKEYEELSFSNLTDFLVGIEENEDPSTGSGTLTVYPNPANGVLYVETRHATSLPVETYRIVNPIGQTVMEGQITAEKQQIDVRNLPQGVYFITVGGATRKFVVE